jgi:hypothetical protein
MTIKEQQLEAVKLEIGNIPHNPRCAYVNGMALRQLFAEREQAFLFTLSQHPAPEVLNIGNSLNHIYTHAQSDTGHGFSNLKAIVDLSENSHAFKTAYALIQPLVDRVAVLESEIQAEMEAESRARSALHEAEEAARAAAEEKLAKDPAVIAARKAFEAAQPALVAEPTPDIVLTRGKVKLEEQAQA